MGKENGAVNWKRVLILAGAVIAFTIGSGFATGQEIIQYSIWLAVNSGYSWLCGHVSVLQF